VTNQEGTAESGEYPRPPLLGRPHFSATKRNWPLPTALPVTIKSWRRWIVWSIYACIAPWTLVLVLISPILLLVPVLLTLIPVWTLRLGFTVTESGVQRWGYLRRSLIKRERVSGFVVKPVLHSMWDARNARNGGRYYRLGVRLRSDDGLVLLPRGEDLLIPAQALANRLNELYGLKREPQ
jgi:hypothetical protein